MNQLEINIISLDEVVENLTKLVGTEFSRDEIVIAFEDYEEDGETNVIISDLENGRNEYSVHIDTKDSTEIIITVENGIIKTVRS